MNKKLFQSILLIFTFLLNTSLISANNFDEEGWHFAAIATGKTTGHIGDLIINNKTEKANTIWLGSYIIPPENGKQGYAILKEEIEQVEIKPGDSLVHKLNGYCINVELTPVAEKEAFPHYLKWLSTKNFDTAFVEQWNQADEKPERLNFNSQLEQAAPIILEAVKKLEDQYYTWKSPLQIPDIYPDNADVVKEAIIQQAVWQFTAALQGKPYTFPQFEESIVQQGQVKVWLSSIGGGRLMVDDQAIKNKTYFNYQCQKLWSMITDLNFYINPNSRKLIPNWEINTGELQDKYIEFIELWESVALTGDHFKAEKSKRAAPVLTEEASEKKKIWPFLAGGIGTAGVTTGVILLTRKKGCTDSSACNYDVAAKVDDGMCEYGMTNCFDPCNPVKGCTDTTACNFDPIACIEDGSCEYNNPYCADPCNPVIGCTDATACNYNNVACIEDGSCDYGNTACANPCNSVLGCINPVACNYEEDANCDDGSCDYGNTACADPCNPVLGCMNPVACNYEEDANCDDGSCIFSPCNPGCADPCAENYDPMAEEDDGSCEPYNMDCNNDCTLGDVEKWDSENCKCVVDIPNKFGCTDATACNYDINANCDDDSCKPIPICNTDPCIGDIEIVNGCTCDLDQMQVLGCTDHTATNYDADANCDDESCIIETCEDSCAPNFGASEACKPYNMNCNTDCNIGDITIWNIESCSCEISETVVKGCRNSEACNYNPMANCDDVCDFGNTACPDPCKGISGCADPTACNFNPTVCYNDDSCAYPDCDENCGGTALPGAYCDNRKGIYNNNCECIDRKFDCSLNKGIVQFCNSTNNYLFNINGILYHPEFDLIMEEFDCLYNNIAPFEGQIVKFDYYEITRISSCNPVAQQIMLTCIEFVEKSNCNYQYGTLSYENCEINGIENYHFTIKLENGKIINPWANGCHYFFRKDTFQYVFAEGTKFKLDFEKANFNYPCDPNIEAVVLTCIDTVTLAKTNESNPDYHQDKLTPFFENRLLTTPIQNSEYPKTTVITNILGINYHKPVTPTIFIENQTAVGYLSASDLHFLNNKITLNAKNKHLPIHYGLGFNSNQLTDILSLTDWQNELIWNLRIKLPIFKKLQLEAEVFKSFKVEDDPNCSIRLIYQQTKSDKPLEKKKF